MLETALSLTILGSAVLVALAAIDWRQCLQNAALFGLFLSILFIDNLIIVGVNQYPALQFIPNGHWGTILLTWSGKLVSILVCLAIAFLIRPVISLDQLGLRLRQKAGSLGPALAALALVSAAAAWIGSGWEKGPFSLTLLVYMAVMPGLNEELVYRGLLLGILDKISPAQWSFLGARIGWGVWITALLFGLLHGFWVDSTFALHFQWFPVAFSSVTGFVFAWQKERTGSLLWPVLTHGAIDSLIVLVRMVG